MPLDNVLSKYPQAQLLGTCAAFLLAGCQTMPGIGGGTNGVMKDIVID
jgi:predicted small secreted protein